MTCDEASEPDDVWQRFLSDSEQAIRHSAPREPSAEERAASSGARHTGIEAASAAATEHLRMVGEPWHPQDPPGWPTWRELEPRARRRRIGRILVSAAALAAVLTIVSRLPTDTGPQEGRPGGITLQESEDTPGELPSRTLSEAPMARPTPSAQ
ncbi:hypothetical protein [Streptomyces sp. NPDC020607]|uniref:hypothetical protein n=1 Tax=Streptomyces sp. NPDC020607 TaxID=3365082 RepID=UPI0037A0F908